MFYQFHHIYPKLEKKVGSSRYFFLDNFECHAPGEQLAYSLGSLRTSLEPAKPSLKTNPILNNAQGARYQ